MKWVTALAIGALLGFVLPLSLGGQEGAWMTSWAKWGTIRPFHNQPGLIFSIPIFLISGIGLRMFFNWHTR